ncbi:MAG: hypothetical protein JWM68_3455 [Verrucomicrobiales bacterium]|nr:hypothetical protein [Verrucomicrobiales bacterium]
MPVLVRFYFVLISIVLTVSQVSAESGVTKVNVTAHKIEISIAPISGPCDLVELSQGETNFIGGRTSLIRLDKRKISLDRFAGTRDRLYSGFLAIQNERPLGTIHYAEEIKNISRHSDPYPQVKSKKGLQVQMVDDALTLGVKHAAINFDFGRMVSLKPATNDLSWPMDGRTFHFQRSYVEHTDARIKRLSDAGVVITLILLNYENADEQQNKILLHPNYDKACPQNLSAFNTTTPEGLAWFKACMEFLADRYSESGFPHGRVANYIVGNEVNSHWWWANMGHVTREEFVNDYARTVRVCNTAVRKFSSSARVFISLEHHWNIHFPSGDDTQAFAGHPFIDRFNEVVKAGGDFDWNLAFHPYPENLFNARFWEDKTATFSADTPRITFKNLELLTQYFKRAPLLYHGKPRHIILSEQGFHSDGTPVGEELQAAAYCYAFYKVDRMEGIDSFILHRHVDHPAEGGLNLGLWRRNGDSAEPLSKKPLYEVFRSADTPQWKQSFKFALPIIGIASWEELAQHGRSKK